MLKKRIIPCILVHDDRAVKSMNFEDYQIMGYPEVAIKSFNSWSADELALIDIDATMTGAKPNLALITHVSKVCFMPLAVGGGIKTLDDARSVIKVGADKVIVNNEARSRPAFITELAAALGAQAVVVCIDIIKTNKGYKVYDYKHKQALDIDPIIWAKAAQMHGAGELLIQCVHKDGTLDGYDVEFLNDISKSINIPIIALGGAGKSQHISELFTRAKLISAAAVSNMLHFNEQSVRLIKKECIENKIPVREELR